MEVLWPQGPFIPALGSALRGETGPGHLGTRGPPPAIHVAPMTSDDCQLLPVSLYELRATSPSSLE